MTPEQNCKNLLIVLLSLIILILIFTIGCCPDCLSIVHINTYHTPQGFCLQDPFVWHPFYVSEKSWQKDQQEMEAAKVKDVERNEILDHVKKMVPVKDKVIDEERVKVDNEF